MDATRSGGSSCIPGLSQMAPSKQTMLTGQVAESGMVSLRPPAKKLDKSWKAVTGLALPSPTAISASSPRPW